MSLRKIKDNLIALNNLRKFAGYGVFSQAVKSNFKLEIVDRVLSGRILVLSPHPDDDVFGCGGVIKLHSKNNSDIRVVYLTDGSGGSDLKLNKKEKEKLIAQRETEAQSAAMILGVNKAVFWRYPDGHLKSNKTTKKLLSTLISDLNPDIIYAPSVLDPHPDHFEACCILKEALAEVKFDGTILSYEIWSPIFANRLVCIDETADQKELAILEHKSQLKSRNYFDAIMGLNKYRAGMYGIGQYAEAFFSCNRELYLKLFEILKLEK